MKKYILNTIAFILLFITIVITLAVISSAIVKNRGFRNWETESNLLMMKKNHHYDLAFIGISHARNFSRHKNHLRLEQILGGKDIINLGKGSSLCGTSMLTFYMDYFYSRNNSCDTIIYVLSPSMMYAKFLDRATNSFNDEPFEFDFLFQYLHTDLSNKYERLYYYIRSKLTIEWLRTKPYSKESMDYKLDSLDPSAIKEGMKLAYLDGNQAEVFRQNCKHIEKMIHSARDHNSRMIFIIPPALFGKWKGHYETIAFLEDVKEKYHFNYYDFSESVLEPGLYYDHHHLNSAGVEYFTEKYLMPILN
jgi:hypothetical protein